MLSTALKGQRLALPVIWMFCNGPATSASSAGSRGLPRALQFDARKDAAARRWAALQPLYCYRPGGPAYAALAIPRARASSSLAGGAASCRRGSKTPLGSHQFGPSFQNRREPAGVPLAEAAEILAVQPSSLDRIEGDRLVPAPALKKKMRRLASVWASREGELPK